MPKIARKEDSCFIHEDILSFTFPLPYIIPAIPATFNENAHTWCCIFISREPRQQQFREHRVNSSGVMYDNANNEQARAIGWSLSLSLSLAIASTMLVRPRCLPLDVDIKDIGSSSVKSQFPSIVDLSASYLSGDRTMMRKRILFRPRQADSSKKIIPRQTNNFSLNPPIANPMFFQWPFYAS